MMLRAFHWLRASFTNTAKFFPAEKIIMTGNPVRQNLLGHAVAHEEAVSYFSLNPSKKTILIPVSYTHLDVYKRQSWD